ncbi:hypothetical protein BKA65DRAFT_564501 [Rhexocercosporidium sp. MPI-PUGE-AT-0058]|nr:hypothetical protein BKA65DRAFT_564501 [Rhexocercosporidium sp. MPI-PUGE-AT-0058]
MSFAHCVRCSVLVYDRSAIAIKAIILLYPACCMEPSSPDFCSMVISLQIGQAGSVDNVAMDETVGAVSTFSGSGDWVFDTVSIPFPNEHKTLPDGTTYPAQIRKLVLGAPEFNQSWLHFPPDPRWNGNLLPSSMFAQGLTSSISYGMHIDSPALGIPGPLIIGGHDHSRALGIVSSQAYSINHLPIDLLEMGIGVAEGDLPFDFKSKVRITSSRQLINRSSYASPCRSSNPLYLPPEEHLRRHHNLSASNIAGKIWPLLLEC